MRQFCFFSVFFGAFLHFKRYDHDVYMFLILQNIPERTVEADFWFEPSIKFFWYPKWPRKPKTVEYSTCVSCFNLEKRIRRTISCHKIQSVPIIIMKLLPIDSSDVGEAENHPQRMLKVLRKWFRGSRTSLTLFRKILIFSISLSKNYAFRLKGFSEHYVLAKWT